MNHTYHIANGSLIRRLLEIFRADTQKGGGEEGIGDQQRMGQDDSYHLCYLCCTHSTAPPLCLPSPHKNKYVLRK